MRFHALLSTALLISSLATAQATSNSTTLSPAEIGAQWQQIAFNTAKNEQVTHYAKLSESLNQALEHQTSPDAELLTWAGIVNASYAGAQGGLGALKIAKTAKTQLEQALAINPHAGKGGAMTTLGMLYDKVPGWPLGFGSDKKAKQLLQTAAEQHPNNLVSQYFWGEFLHQNQQNKAAQTVFEHAITLPVRPQAQLADKARLESMRRTLVTLRESH